MNHQICPWEFTETDRLSDNTALKQTIKITIKKRPLTAYNIVQAENKSQIYAVNKTKVFSSSKNTKIQLEEQLLRIKSEQFPLNNTSKKAKLSLRKGKSEFNFQLKNRQICLHQKKIMTDSRAFGEIKSQKNKKNKVLKINQNLESSNKKTSTRMYTTHKVQHNSWTKLKGQYNAKLSEYNSLHRKPSVNYLQKQKPLYLNIRLSGLINFVKNNKNETLLNEQSPKPLNVNKKNGFVYFNRQIQS